MVDPGWILVALTVITVILALPPFIRDLRGSNPGRITTLIIIGVLVLISCATTGYDFYDRHNRPVVDIPAIDNYWDHFTQYNDFYRRTYSHETAILDGLRCLECTFDNATLQWNGTAPFDLVNSIFITPHRQTAPGEPAPRGPGPNISLQTSNPIIASTLTFLTVTGAMVPGLRFQMQPWIPPLQSQGDPK